MMPLVQKISRYIDHLGDSAWITELCGEAGVEPVLDAVSAILRQGEPLAIHNALTFCRDLGIHGVVAASLANAARSEMPKLLFPALQGCLYARPYPPAPRSPRTMGHLAPGIPARRDTRRVTRLSRHVRGRSLCRS